MRRKYGEFIQFVAPFTHLLNGSPSANTFCSTLTRFDCEITVQRSLKIVKMVIFGEIHPYWALLAFVQAGSREKHYPKGMNCLVQLTKAPPAAMVNKLKTTNLHRETGIFESQIQCPWFPRALPSCDLISPINRFLKTLFSRSSAIHSRWFTAALSCLYFRFLGAEGFCLRLDRFLFAWTSGRNC